MRARRVCACGAELLETGDALLCTGCGAQPRIWRVVLDGRTIATGMLPGHHSKPEIAFTGPFEIGLLSLLDPPQAIRYAVPSSWRHQHRRHQAERD